MRLHPVFKSHHVRASLNELYCYVQNTHILRLGVPGILLFLYAVEWVSSQ
jgi:hypothetical protein